LEDVIAITAPQHVAPAAAEDELVVTLARVEVIVTLAAGQPIRLASAEEPVVAGPALELISAIVGFGVLTWVAKMGHGIGLIGLDRTGPIESFVPPIAFAILFGLSMDYEVFLMSRIREEHIHGKTTIPAVRSGVAAIGRVVFAAAIIMSSVFFAFLLTPDRVSKEFGLLLAVAILVDALIMRLTVVPAFLALLGERSWAMPAWLDRILPKLTIEPPTDEAPTVSGVEERPVPVT